MNNINYTAIFVLILLSYACNNDAPQTSGSTIENLESSYTLLPEEQISISHDKTVLACYANPTERYAHGILGDKIEGGQLVIAKNTVFHELSLQEEYVFEDIRPRLYDVDKDGHLEFITIRSNVNTGAGIVIYKLLIDQLIEYARVVEIGNANRWLNVVAIEDLDDDGIIEIAWIETPHIGGILKVAKIQPGILEVLSQKSLYSNHAIGQRNLCLSALTLHEDQNKSQQVFYVPNQTRDSIVGFSFDGVDLQVHEKIEMDVDFSVPLKDQYPFLDLFDEEEDHCIF